MELLIPCILHLENRIGEKIITIIFRRAWNDCRGRKDEFISQINGAFQTKVLGTEDSPSQWKIPVSKDSEQNLTIEHIQVGKNGARCIVDGMDTIIEEAW
jgi:hypothetical protein